METFTLRAVVGLCTFLLLLVGGAKADQVVRVSVVQPVSSGVVYGLTALPQAVNSMPIPQMPLQVSRGEELTFTFDTESDFATYPFVLTFSSVGGPNVTSALYYPNITGTQPVVDASQNLSVVFPLDGAPRLLYYQSTANASLGGAIVIGLPNDSSTTDGPDANPPANPTDFVVELVLQENPSYWYKYDFKQKLASLLDIDASRIIVTGVDHQEEQSSTGSTTTVTVRLFVAGSGGELVMRSLESSIAANPYLFARYGLPTVSTTREVAYSAASPRLSSPLFLFHRLLASLLA